LIYGRNLVNVKRIESKLLFHFIFVIFFRWEVLAHTMRGGQRDFVERFDDESSRGIKNKRTLKEWERERERWSRNVHKWLFWCGKVNIQYFYGYLKAICQSLNFNGTFSNIFFFTHKKERFWITHVSTFVISELT
jgi:hypothetical protein